MVVWNFCAKKKRFLAAFCHELKSCSTIRDCSLELNTLIGKITRNLRLTCKRLSQLSHSNYFICQTETHKFIFTIALFWFFKFMRNFVGFTEINQRVLTDFLNVLIQCSCFSKVHTHHLPRLLSRVLETELQLNIW